MKSLSLPLFALAMLAPWLAAYNAYPAEPPVEAPATAPAVPPTTGPYSGQQLSLMVKAIEDLRQENAQLRGTERYWSASESVSSPFLLMLLSTVATIAFRHPLALRPYRSNQRRLSPCLSRYRCPRSTRQRLFPSKAKQ